MSRTRTSQILFLFLFLAGLLLAAPAAIAAPAEEREVQIEDVQLPFYLPAWGGEHPLQFILERIGEGDLIAARTGLEKLCAESDGLLLPPLKSKSEQEPPASPMRIPPPGEALAEWFRTNSRVSELPPRDDSHLNEEPLRGISELLCNPGRREAARARFEVSLALGKFDDAERVLASPNAPTLPAAILASLDGEILSRALVRDAHGLRATFPEMHPPGHALPEKLVLLNRDAIPWAPALSDGIPLDEVAMKRLTRRAPLAAIYPLVSDDQLYLTDGGSMFRYQHGNSPRLLEKLPLSLEAQPSLRHLPLLCAAGGRIIAFPVRTSRRELSLGGVTPLNILEEGDPPGFQGAAFLELSEEGKLQRLPCEDLDPLGAQGWTLCGSPLFSGARAVLPLVRGDSALELMVLCYDFESKRIAWRRKLATRPIPVHSRSDSRSFLSEVSLACYGPQLWITSDFGFIARLDLASGDYAGALFYTRYDDALPSRAVSTVGNGLFSARAAPRPRQPGPAILVPRAPNHAPLIVLLPPDARALLALDMERFKIVWQHPVREQEMVLGMSGAGCIVLLDAGIRAGDSALTLSELDPHTGAMARDPLTLRLSDAPPVRKDGAQAAKSAEKPDEARNREMLRPLLSGVPRLAGDVIWVPTLRGLEIWNLDDSLPRDRAADRFLAWPAGSIGGTPLPLPGGRLATVQRGDMELGWGGMIEIYEGAAPR